MLQQGQTAVDVVAAVTVLLEDCIYFNAGRGSVFTHNGTIEMDAAIMDGSDMRAGSCACVSRVKNPILLARTIMDQTKHILLVGFVRPASQWVEGIVVK
jgi:beta-aspartyl-peptidase (threonine type)